MALADCLWHAPSNATRGGVDSRVSPQEPAAMPTPIRVAVTGAAGQIGYQLIFRIASGEVFGANQPVILHLIEVPPVMPALDGVEMELDDCAFPALAGVVKADSNRLEEGFA